MLGESLDTRIVDLHAAKEKTYTGAVVAQSHTKYGSFGSRENSGGIKCNDARELIGQLRCHT
jgi:hypothetical protein